MTATIDHLVSAKWVITCEENNRILPDHTLAIHQGKIIDILPYEAASQQYQAHNRETFTSHAVMPGFINAHTHVAMNLFRGLADDLELMDWLNNHIWPAESKWVNEPFVYDGSLLAMAEMIRSGTTCFNDMYFFLEATAEAANLAGMRAHIGMQIINVPTAWAKTTEEYFAKAEAFYQQYKNHKLITPTLAPHSTYTVLIKDLERVRRMAEDYHLKTNIHLQEAPSEIDFSLKEYGQRPLQRLHQIGMVSPNLIAIHMTQIDEGDLEILQETKPNIVHCPESNMKLASGCCPVEKLKQKGVNIALGTDGAASNNDLDIIGEMRSAAFLGKMTANDPTAVSAETILKMATLNGAKALGIDHFTGSLSKGKAADFIAINLDSVETQPIYHPVSQIVYATSRMQITDVWVNGKRLLKNRELTTLDEKAILAKAASWRDKINHL